MVKYFITDIDGCLTDGMYEVDSQGNVAKKYFTRDFIGMSLLNDKGIQVYVITASKTMCDVLRIGGSAPYALLYQNVDNKLSLIQKLGLDYDDICYIGDDLLDLPLLKKVGIAACPRDADPEILEFVSNREDGYVLNNNGGRGCIREMVSIILKSLE